MAEKRCVFKCGAWNCGSYQFNLHQDDIDQGELCDVHYWQTKAQRKPLTALEQQAEPEQEQKYEKRIVPYSTPLSMILNTAPPQQQAEQVDCPRCGHVCSQRPWQGLTNEDWEQIHDKKDTALDTFQQGAVWAADQLKEKNT